MKLSTVKSKLTGLSELKFQLPTGQFVPAHFHVTEVGEVSKHFIDCGGKVRRETVANFQLWEGQDIDHQLAPQKLIKIIELSEKMLKLGDLDVEVEYQSDTIGKYGLDFNGQYFLLTSKQTDCLAKEECGLPLATVESSSCCTPEGGCC